MNKENIKVGSIWIEDKKVLTEKFLYYSLS